MTIHKFKANGHIVKGFSTSKSENIEALRKSAANAAGVPVEQVKVVSLVPR